LIKINDYVYPTSTTKNILIGFLLIQELKNIFPKYLTGNLIDIGCGEKPLKKYLVNYISQHIGVDHKATLHDNSNIDIFGTAYEIPVDNCSFDSAICTAALEHLEEPELAIKECYRVLKPGGVAIYSVPFIWHLHEEPRDFLDTQSMD